MPDEDSTPTGAAQAAAENPAPQAQDAEGEPFDAERAMATIRKLRETEKQAKAAAKQVLDLQAKVKQFEDATLTEQQRQQKEADELRQRVQHFEAQEAQWRQERSALLLGQALTSAGQRANMHDPAEAVLHLASDPSLLADDGTVKPEAVEAAVNRLLKQKPHLFRGSTASATNPARSGAAGATDEAALRAAIYGGNATTIFDPAWAAAHGGGVVMPQKGSG